MIRLRQKQKTKMAFRLKGRMDMAEIMEMDRDSFRKLVKDVHETELYKKLSSAELKCIKFRPAFTCFKNTAPFKDEIYEEDGGGGLMSLLGEKRPEVELIKKMGMEDFRKYFLSEDMVDDGAISEKTGLSLSQVENIRGLVCDIMIRGEFFQSCPEQMPAETRSCVKVARLRCGSEGSFSINYFDLNSQRYILDYDKIQSIKESGAISKKEAGELRALLWKLELINSRSCAVRNIVKEIVSFQGDYFKTGDILSLKPLSRRKLSGRISLSHSHISRVVADKCLQTPQDRVLSLDFFFPKRKTVAKWWMESALNGKFNPSSDKQIRTKLEKETGIAVSRRTIAAYRKELQQEEKIPDPERG